MNKIGLVGFIALLFFVGMGIGWYGIFGVFFFAVIALIYSNSPYAERKREQARIERERISEEEAKEEQELYRRSLDISREEQRKELRTILKKHFSDEDELEKRYQEIIKKRNL